MLWVLSSYVSYIFKTYRILNLIELKDIVSEHKDIRYINNQTYREYKDERQELLKESHNIFCKSNKNLGVSKCIFQIVLIYTGNGQNSLCSTYTEVSFSCGPDINI